MFIRPFWTVAGSFCGLTRSDSKPEEVSFVGPTSLALSFIASGLKWRKHDNILIYFDDYPSNVYPWMALAERGVQVRLINTRELGVIRPVDVMGQVDEQTRMVALASCHFVSGSRLEYQAIGKFLHERNILFCLDAIQTVGAFPTTVEKVDFLAADAHKWLLGPCAAGLMYVRHELQEKLRPPVYGWHNVSCPNYVAQEQIVYRKNAHRFEAGTHNLLGIVWGCTRRDGISILEIGVENIVVELLRKRAWLRACPASERLSGSRSQFQTGNSQRDCLILFAGRRCETAGAAQKTRSRQHHHLFAL